MSESASYCPLLVGPSIGSGKGWLRVYKLCTCLQDKGGTLKSERTKPEKENLRLKYEKPGAAQTG